MDPFKQNLYLHLEFGWKIITPAGQPILWGNPRSPEILGAIPDYLNDLNGISVINRLDFDHVKYAEILVEICAEDRHFGTEKLKECFKMVLLCQANAKQRAKAFLTCMGKWQE